MADQRIAGAFVEIYQKGAEKVGPEVERVKHEVKRHLEPEQEGGAMERFLFGKHGTAGIEHTLAHLAGHMGKMFLAGGVFAVGTMITEKLTEALLESATGFGKQAEAAEAATKRIQGYKEAVDAANKAAVESLKGPAAKTQTEQLEASLNPPTVGGALMERIQTRQAEAEKARADAAKEREAAGKATMTDAERANAMAARGAGIGETHGFFEGLAGHIATPWASGRAGAGESTVNGQITMARRSAANRAEWAEARAKEQEAANIADLESTLGAGAKAGMGGLAKTGQSLLGAGGAAVGRLGGMIAGGFRGGQSTTDIVADLKDSLAKPQRGFGGMSLAELREASADTIARRKDLDKRSAFAQETTHLGGAADIGSIGAQIQAAILEPNPFDREWQQLDKEQRDLLKAMDAKMAIVANKPAGAVVAANR
jgi:hypothetical protein